MENFPTEILEQILTSRELNYEDIISFSRTCNRFNQVSSTNSIWCAQFKKKYPYLYPSLSHNDGIDWKNEFTERFTLGQYLDKHLSNMSEKFYSQTELSSTDFSEIDDLLLKSNSDKEFYPFYLCDHLLSIMNDGNPFTNLTNKYYGRKLSRHIQHRLLSADVDQFCKDYNDDQSSTEIESSQAYETALILIAKWHQPHIRIDETEIKMKLDHAAITIFENLKTNHKIDPQKYLLITDLKAAVKDSLTSRNILDATNHYLASEGFQGNSGNYYNQDNSFINRILDTKLGIPISLSLLYLCILSRLGVDCQPINFPRHFLLRWMEHPHIPSEEQRYTYIDVFNGGRRLTSQEALALLNGEYFGNDNIFKVASPVSSTKRMLRNLISIGASQSNNMRDSSYSLLRSSLEMMLRLATDDVYDYAFMLCRVYLQLNINHEEIMRLLAGSARVPGLSDQVEYLLATCEMQKEQKMTENQEIIPKKREESYPYGEVRFKVGQVLQHKKYNYKCVIYGWDTSCTASRSWIRQMSVDKLNQKDKQPFYNVLVEDGSNRYAADENLSMCDPIQIDHPEVGKYFQEFKENVGFICNSQLQKEYPDDQL